MWSVTGRLLETLQASNGGFLAHRNHRGMEMSEKSGTTKLSSERIVQDIRRVTRKQYLAEPA